MGPSMGCLGCTCQVLASIDTQYWEPNIGFMMVAVHRSFTAHKLKMNAQFQDPFGCLLDKMASGSLSHMLQMHRLWPVGA